MRSCNKLPQGWCWAGLPELAASERYSLGIGPFGSNLKVSDYRDTGVPLIFVRNIRTETFEDTNCISKEKANALRPHWVLPGDVLITKMGDPPGDACIYPANRPIGVITADCIRWRIDPLFPDPRYFVYAVRFQGVRDQILNITRGVAQRKVSLARLSGVRIPLAPVQEQQRIISALEIQFSRLDAAVGALKRVKTNLKRYRASVLQAAVEGRLVRTEAELARREGREYEPASVLLGRILKERRRRWEETELARLKGNGDVPKDDRWRKQYQEPASPDTSKLPQLPEGWGWASVDQVGIVSGGLTVNAKRSTNPLRFPYLRVANVYANELRRDDIGHIGVEQKEVARVLLNKHDLLVVEGNGSIEQIGRVALWDGSIEPCLHQNHLIKVRFQPIELARWVLTWLLSSGGRSEIVRVASSTSGLHTLSLSKIGALPVPLCPASEMLRILEKADDCLSMVDDSAKCTESNLSRLARLRQAILKWAFEGKIVDQNPADEPASVVLERIKIQRRENVDQKNPDRAAKRKAE